MIFKLPHSIGRLVKLASLSSREYWEIEELPDSTEALAKLIYLCLYGRSAIEDLPHSWETRIFGRVGLEMFKDSRLT